MSFGLPTPPLFIGKTSGRDGSQKPKMPMQMSHMKGIMGREVELHGAPHMWPANPLGGPP